MPSSEKFWSVACASDYMIMLSTLSQKRSMAFSDGDLALLNYYQYYTLSNSPWTKTSKLTSSTSTLQKHSTLSITKFFSTSLRRMVCQASFMIGLCMDYLSGRRQRVVVDGATSSWAPVTSGVPQGSLLGPILFVIFINDLPDILPDETLAALYADDTKLYKSITSVGDCENLQQALTDLDQWNHENNPDLNESKCKVLTITRRKSPRTYAYHMN